MASSDASKLVSQLLPGVKEQQWLNKTLVPSITLLVFDWLLTLDLEISLVWKSPRSGTKLLFILTRYLPFIDIPVIMYYQMVYTISQRSCKLSYQVFVCMFLIGQCCSIAILTLRTWAVCGKNKLSTYGLFGAFGLMIMSMIVLTVLFLGTATYKPSPFPQLFGCIVSPHGHGPAYLASIYVILMTYDGGLLLLMITQGVFAFKTAGESKLRRVVFRDGILYYIYIFGLSLTNAVLILRLLDVTKYMLVPIERVIYSLLACRVVLHIREQGEKEKQSFTATDEVTGPIRFVQATQMTAGRVMTDPSEGLDE